MTITPRRALVGLTSLAAALCAAAAARAAAPVTDFYVFGGDATLVTLMDVNTLHRNGDLVSVRIVTVTRTRTDGYDYVTSDEVVDCKGKTIRVVSAQGFQMGGSGTGAVSTSNSADTFEAGTIGESEWDFACNGAREPSVHLGPVTADAGSAAVRAKWPAE
jgi:hypothetical protein